jgi:cob(I)alamin adenosyltransferase
MKIYTKTGDDGDTGLFGGSRVPKFHLRVRAYGDLDELNSALGLARALLSDPATAEDGAGPVATVTGSVSVVKARMAEVQKDLFTIGAHFASARPPRTRLDPGAVSRLECWIDDAEVDLPPLQTFILPGGSPAGAQLHAVRTVCRRAERTAWELRTALADGTVDPGKATPDEVVPDPALVYLNRLSDLAFTWARLVNQVLGCPETPWLPDTT